jgi:hypothetical protein
MIADTFIFFGAIITLLIFYGVFSKVKLFSLVGFFLLLILGIFILTDGIKLQDGQTTITTELQNINGTFNVTYNITNNISGNNNYTTGLFSQRYNNNITITETRNGMGNLSTNFLVLPNASAICSSGYALTSFSHTTAGTSSSCVSLPSISGTTDTITKFNSPSTIGDSSITDDGTTTRINRGGGSCQWDMFGSMTFIDRATTFNIVQVNLESVVNHPLDEVEANFVPKEIAMLYQEGIQSNQWMNFIMPHDYKENTPIYIRLHWRQEDRNHVDWVIERGIRNKCTDFNKDWIKEGMTEYCQFISNPMHQISYLVVNPAQEGIWIDDLIQVHLYREANDEYNGDVFAYVVDILYEQNTLGSETLWTKLDV